MSFGGSMLFDSDYQLVIEPEEELKLAQFLINQVADAAFYVGLNAQIIYVNDAMCRISEYSREELLRMKVEDIDVDFSAQDWSEKWAALKQQGSLTFQSRYQTKTSRVFLVEINLTYIEYQGKEFACAFARSSSNELVGFNVQQYLDRTSDPKQEFEQEVIEYQRTQTELKTSLSLLSSTLESTANGILAVNIEGEILCYNQKFMEMWQLCPNSVSLSKKCHRAKSFFENKVKYPEIFIQAVWEMPIQSDKESYDLVELKDGRVFAHYSEPQRLGDKIIGRVWSIWDVTESLKTQEALKLNEARFRTLAETTEASIFLISDGRICYANSAAEILTGYPKKELFNNFDINRLITSKKLRQVHKQNGAGYSEYQEMQIRTKNGVERWLACTVGVLDGVLDFANKSVELLTAIDITDYKQAESELHQALEQAKRLSELRERFVSMFCHQFRTPLNIVSFSADLLRRHIHQWTEEKNRSYLDLIQVAVQQISELLDEILLYGQAESARLECQPRQLNLERFCTDIVAQLQIANGNQKAIKFLSQGDCSTGYLDPKLLHHILTNLLSNAIKYSPSNSAVTFRLCCEKEKTIFQIKDSGIGIPVVDQQQIFEPFYRGSNIDSIPGTGLGLSIVKTLLDLHGGEITVESVVGFGTTFTVNLPSLSS
ncbi:PAS domain-containing sensor histidine kinase [Brasilonema octagenarum UFV-E1]|uniref:histidine kinase n=1 Tax=Brasilonema sennae CENA114 TaxID=415709 RepID=A0A856M755_9CYAN|nr:scytonemin biosynthesis sensor histidine kinase [Brasilonema sennae]QDL06973.1 PAS domain-containing sensor histidine kinase [Brasilonema sennae CENA114]QDL13336.1 PAS domain-containing sensor histidine kinase [Brasilonema octagenarum UFV-E1]